MKDYNIKDHSVYPTFVFESAGYFQSIGFSKQHTLKGVSLHQKLVYILPCIVFSKQNVIWLCAPYFEKVLHGKIRTKF